MPMESRHSPVVLSNAAGKFAEQSDPRLDLFLECLHGFVGWTISHSSAAKPNSDGVESLASVCSCQSTI